MQLIDTHCHIHDPEFTAKYPKTTEVMLLEAHAAGVEKCIVVGTSGPSSQLAVEFAQKYAQKYGVYATLALHPHEVAEQSHEQLQKEFKLLEKLATEDRVVAIGECGLDYYYHKSEAIQSGQKALLRQHIELALKHDLPLVFHIRSAFDDFFEIIDEYTANGHKPRGVVHSFSAHLPELAGALDHGFYISLNGIMTFTKDEHQLQAAKAVPLDKLVLETDAPFLTPKPFRGTMCEIKQVVLTAEFLSQLREEPLAELAQQTTRNAVELFKL